MRQLLAATFFSLSLGCVPKPVPVSSLPVAEPDPDPVAVINTTLDQKVIAQWNEDHSGYQQYYEQFPFSVMESGVVLPSTLDANNAISAYFQQGYHALFENSSERVTLISYYFRMLSDTTALHTEISQLKKSVSDLSSYDKLVTSGLFPEDKLRVAYAQAASSLQETLYRIPLSPSEPLVFYLVSGVPYFPEQITVGRQKFPLLYTGDMSSETQAVFKNISPSVILGRNTQTSLSPFVTEIQFASFDAELGTEEFPYVSVTTYFDVPSTLYASISALVREGKFSEINHKHKQTLQATSYIELVDLERDGIHALDQPERYDELCIAYQTGELSTRACHSFALTRERKEDLLAPCLSNPDLSECTKNKNEVAFDLELQQRTALWYHQTLGILDARISEANRALDSDAIAVLLERNSLRDDIQKKREAYSRLLRDRYFVTD